MFHSWYLPQRSDHVQIQLSESHDVLPDSSIGCNRWPKLCMQLDVFNRVCRKCFMAPKPISSILLHMVVRPTVIPTSARTLDIENEQHNQKIVLYFGSTTTMLYIDVACLSKMIPRATYYTLYDLVVVD